MTRRTLEPRGARAGLRLGLALCALALPAGAQAPRGVAEVLRSAVEGEPADRLGRELARLGPEALPTLFSTLEQGELAPAEDGAPAQRLDPFQRSVVLNGLLAQPLPELRAFLETNVGAESSAAARGIAITVLAEVGDGADLRFLARAAELRDAASDAPVFPLGGQLEDAVAKILARDDRTYGRLLAIVGDVDPGLGVHVARGLGAGGSRRALKVLGDVLAAGWLPAPDVLAEIARVAERCAAPFDGPVVARTRALLASEDLPVVRAAARTVGRLEDFEAIPLLIEMLDARDPALREAAHDALQAVSGHGFNADPRRWQSWYSSERDWWEDESAEVFERLHGDSVPQAIRAIGQIVTKRLYRHELVDELAPLLGHEDAQVRRVACLGLGQIRSNRSLPALAEALDDVDEGVQAAARSSLEALTGWGLPADAAAWRTAIERGDLPAAR